MNVLKMTPALVSRLAASVEGEMRHTQKLDAFAIVLGYPDQTAMMRHMAQTGPAEHVRSCDEMLYDLVIAALRKDLSSRTGFFSNENQQDYKFMSEEDWISFTMKNWILDVLMLDEALPAYMDAPQDLLMSRYLSQSVSTPFYGLKTFAEYGHSIIPDSALKMLAKMEAEFDVRKYDDIDKRRDCVEILTSEIRKSWCLLPDHAQTQRLLNKHVITKMAKSIKPGMEDEHKEEAITNVLGFKDVDELNTCLTYLAAHALRLSEFNQDTLPNRVMLKRMLKELHDVRNIIAANLPIHDPRMNVYVRLANRAFKVAEDACVVTLTDFGVGYIHDISRQNILIGNGCHLLSDIKEPWATDIADHLHGLFGPFGKDMHLDPIIDALLTKRGREEVVLTLTSVRDMFKVPDGPYRRYDRKEEFASFLSIPSDRNDLYTLLLHLCSGPQPLLTYVPAEVKDDATWILNDPDPAVIISRADFYLKRAQGSTQAAIKGAEHSTKGKLEGIHDLIVSTRDAAQKNNPDLSVLSQQSQKAYRALDELDRQRDVEDDLNGRALRCLQYAQTATGKAADILKRPAIKASPEPSL